MPAWFPSTARQKCAILRGQSLRRSTSRRSFPVRAAAKVLPFCYSRVVVSVGGQDGVRGIALSA
jgi:hypothetical protein